MSDDDDFIVRHTCRYEPPEKRVFPCQGCEIESGPCQVCVELGRAGMDPTGEIPCSVCLPTMLCQSCGLPMGPFACETCDGDD